MTDYEHPGDAAQARPITVVVRYTGNSPEDKERSLEKALQQFKKIVQKEGLMQELKDRQSFQSAGRKRYLQRQKFYYRLENKKEKVVQSFRKRGWVDKKEFNEKGGGYTPHHRFQQQQRPYQPIKRFNHDRKKSK